MHMASLLGRQWGGVGSEARTMAKPAKAQALPLGPCQCRVVPAVSAFLKFAPGASLASLWLALARAELAWSREKGWLPVCFS